MFSFFKKKKEEEEVSIISTPIIEEKREEEKSFFSRALEKTFATIKTVVPQKKEKISCRTPAPSRRSCRAASPAAAESRSRMRSDAPPR